MKRCILLRQGTITGDRGCWEVSSKSTKGVVWYLGYIPRGFHIGDTVRVVIELVGRKA